MHYTTLEKGDALLVYLSGNILGSDAYDILREGIAPHLAQHPKAIIFNFEEVKVMNSTGIGLLIRVFNEVREEGGQVLLVNPSSNVQRVLAITKVDTVFPTYDSDEAAIAAAQAK